MKFIVGFLALLNGVLTPLLFISAFIFLYRWFALKAKPNNYTKDIPPEAVGQWIALMRRQAIILVIVGFGWFFIKILFIKSEPPLEEIVFLIPFGGVVYAALCGSRAAQVRKNPQLVFIKKENTGSIVAGSEAPITPKKLMIERISIYLMALPFLYVIVGGLTLLDPVGINLSGELLGRFLGAVFSIGIFYAVSLVIKKIFKLSRLGPALLIAFGLFNLLFIYTKFIAPVVMADFRQKAMTAAFHDTSLIERSLGDTGVSIRSATDFEPSDENEKVIMFLSGKENHPLMCMVTVTKPEWIKAKPNKGERKIFLEAFFQDFAFRIGAKHASTFSKKEVTIGGNTWIRREGTGNFAKLEAPGVLTALYRVGSKRDVMIFLFITDDAPGIVKAAKETILASIKM